MASTTSNLFNAQPPTSLMTLKDQIARLPHQPGVYKFFDADDRIIYVGKAVDLRNRVSSYFVNSNQHNAKTRRLVMNIRQLEIQITDTESDAFLLENNLIKQHQPKYNILLKDGKSYPYLCLTSDRFPRLLTTRQKLQDGSRYYGPYASGAAMNTVLELIRTLYPLRTCTYNLSVENVEARKYKVCLEYHLGNCKGPCEALEDEATYNGYITQVRHLLAGNLGPARVWFREQMTLAAQQQQFEQAHAYKVKLDRLDDFQARSTVVSQTITHTDVVAIASNEQYAFINYLRVMNGAVILTKSLEVQKKLDESDADILASMILELRAEFESDSPEVLVNVGTQVPLKSVSINVPQIGDKKKLLNLALKNALYLRKEKESMNEKSKDVNEVRIMETMQRDLRLTELPRHIECFDNSNFQGDNPVAAMVLFRNARPAKKEYRHYHVKTVQGPNDFDSMYEIVTRRYRRLLDEGTSLPQLIVVDGGKGQLSMAVKALKDLNIWGQVPIIGIAKRLEEIYVPGDSFPLYIDKKSETLRLIQRMRDEAHRFGITFHRSRRDASTLKTELTEVKGLGPATAEKLLTKHKSVKKIRELADHELAAEIGPAKARLLLAWFAEHPA